MNKKKKIAVALSGGVDSSYCVYLLSKRYKVEAFTLKIPFMPSDYIERAHYICKKIGIIHHVIDVEKEFPSLIVNYFIESYLQGFTPNPCALCNRLVKFGLLIEIVKKKGFRLFATGHYASLIKKNRQVYLAASKADKNSQEYFLALVPKETFKMCIFPLSNYTKDEVKRKAKDFYPFKVSSSQEVCFIRHKDYRGFILEHAKKSNFCYGYIRYRDGKVLGRHSGIHNFTYGQRQGLGISWKSPLYVFDINPTTGDVFVAEKEYAFKKDFFVGSINWFYPPKDYINISVRLRYNSNPLSCKIKLINKKRVKCTLYEKKDIPSYGQVAVFYDEKRVIAGGVIER